MRFLDPKQPSNLQSAILDGSQQRLDSASINMYIMISVLFSQQSDTGAGIFLGGHGCFFKEENMCHA